MKGVYDDGHLVEYAVFAPDEIALATAQPDAGCCSTGADVRRPDGGGRAGRPTAPATPSRDRRLARRPAAHRPAGRRAAAPAGRAPVRDRLRAPRSRCGTSWCCWPGTSPAERPEARDNLNPFRRVEQAYPAVGRELAPGCSPPATWRRTARGLLDLAARELAGTIDTGSPAWQTVRRYLG